MSRKIVLQVVCFSLFIAASSFASPDSVIVPGDLRIQGEGSGLVFPDGSMQFKAVEQGPKGDKGDPGPQGPACQVTLSAGDGLIASPVNPITTTGTLQVNYGGSGGAKGTALTVSRSDHSHDELKPTVICWSMAKTEDEHGVISHPQTFITIATLFKISNDRYLVQGYTEVPNDNPSVMTGSGIIYNNQLFLTATSAQEHTSGPWRDAGTVHVRVDTTTMNGTFFNTRFDFNTSTRSFEQAYAAGTITSVSCP